MASFKAKVDRRQKVLARALRDPYAFCGLLFIKTKSGKRVRLKLNRTQLLYLRDRTLRDIILKARQVGLTTVLLALDVMHFLSRKGASVQVVVQSDSEQKLYREIIERVSLFFTSLRDAGMRIEFEDDSSGYWTIKDPDGTIRSFRISVAGGSQQKAEKIGRGATITRLHLTEPAFYEYPEATFNALNESVPGIESGSEIVIESTANGAGGHYHEMWQAAVRGVSGYRAHFFRWWDHEEYDLGVEPGERVTPENDDEKDLVARGVTAGQLKWYRRKLGEKTKDLIRQEYPPDPETCFLVSGRPFFDMEVIAQLQREALPPRRELLALPDFLRRNPPLPSVTIGAPFRIWKEPVAGHNYVVSVDTAEGKVTSGRNEKDKSDYCSAKVLDRNGEHVATLHGRWEPWEFARRLAPIGRMYNMAEIAVERNNHGHAVIAALDKGLGYPNIWRDYDGAFGWLQNHAKRTRMLDQLNDALREGEARTSDTLFLGEARTFVIGPDGKAAAVPGTHDDTVIDYAIGWSVICTPRAAVRDTTHLPPR